MAWSIPTAFVDQFSETVRMLAGQRDSRLRRTVTVDTDITGESKSYDFIGLGADTANVVVTRHGDTPLNDQEHTRRWVYPVDYDVADLIDRPDKAKMLIDPTSAYVRNHAGTMGRTMDEAIIAAFDGIVKTGRDASGTSSFPSGQNIAHGSTGLTIAKLITARELLDAAEVDPEQTRWLACTARQISNLLNDDKITSADYNTVRALVAGQVDTFMGFRFVQCQRLKASSGVRNCFAYTSDAITLAVSREPSTIASERPDKRHSWQIYTSGAWGAVRMEDVRVVRIQCQE
ncbi:MAG: phage capsid protein [Thermomicrobium sp.]|nr:phage capsid protein [Thermomicrobium sp.]